MARKRTLKDLYVRGKLVTVDDGEGPIEVWVQKLNPVEYTQCLKKADAARARALSALRDKESDDYQAAIADLMTADRENLITLLCSVERGRLTPVVEAQVGANDKWSEDNYLSGLYTAWEDLEPVFIDDPEDKEAAKVKKALDEFVKECEAELEEQMEGFKSGLEAASDDELLDLTISHNIKLVGDITWMNEFYRQEVMAGVRDPENHSKKILETREDVDALQGEAYGALSEAVRAVMVDPVEGKDLAGRPPSSTSSEQSEQEET